MLILTIRTDKPESEIGLFNGNEQVTYHTWDAHRQLAETLHLKINELLQSNDKSWQDIGGVVCYKGPGSFTGLRIGLAVANALAYSLRVPLAATAGDEWISIAIDLIQKGDDVKIAQPDYGSEAQITTPKK